MAVRKRSIPRSRHPYATAEVENVTFTVGAEGGDTINVGLVLKDARNKAATAALAVRAWLSSLASGANVVANPPNTSVAVGTNGALIPGGAYPLNALLQVGGLAIDVTPEKFKTTATAIFTVAGQLLTKTAATAIVFSAAHVVNATKFGVILVQVNAAGAVSTKVPLSPQVYTTAPLALAALPAPDVGKVALGYIAIAAGAGNWTANTDDMTNGSDLTTAGFVDATVSSLVPTSFTLVSDTSGRVDINVKDTTARTVYLAVQMPDGSISVSGAVTFA